MDIATEYVDVGLRVRLWDTNEGYKAIPRSDATVEVVVLPGLTMMGEGLSERGQGGV